MNENQPTNGNEIGLSLVTGGTGLLGSHIVEQLVRRGRKVRALVRPGSDVTFLRSQGAELVEGDVTDAASLERACDGVDRVYHSAARVGDWGPWEEFVAITIDGTQKLIDAAHRAKCRRFLHISSISAYGYVDGEGKVFDESAPLGAKLHKWGYYTRAKVEAEKLVWQSHRDGKIAVTVIRPSWLYGPRDRATIGRLIASIRKRRARLVGTGDNRLNVVHAANVAECSILAAESEVGSGQAYNSCHDGVLTQRQYFNRIAKVIQEPEVTRSIPYHVAKNVGFMLEFFGHLRGRTKPPFITRYSVWLLGRRCFFECHKAKEQLGWKSTISYEEGIPAAVQDYLASHNGRG